VIFANWVQESGGGQAQSVLCSEIRVAVADRDARVGLAAVRPLITTFHALIGSEALASAVKRAERKRSRVR